jgi:hypothetical protein
MNYKKLKLILILWKSQIFFENYFNLQLQLVSHQINNYLFLEVVKKNLFDLSRGLKPRYIKLKYNLRRRKYLLLLGKYLFK